MCWLLAKFAIRERWRWRMFLRSLVFGSCYWPWSSWCLLVIVVSWLECMCECRECENKRPEASNRARTVIICKMKSMIFCNLNIYWELLLLLLSLSRWTKVFHSQHSWPSDFWITFSENEKNGNNFFLSLNASDIFLWRKHESQYTSFNFHYFLLTRMINAAITLSPLRSA